MGGRACFLYPTNRPRQAEAASQTIIMSDEKNIREVGIDATAAEPTSSNQSPMEMAEPEEPKLSFPQKVWKSFKTPGSALQIVFAAVLAIIIAVQRLKEMADGSGSKLAGWTVGYYVLTTL